VTHISDFITYCPPAAQDDDDGAPEEKRLADDVAVGGVKSYGAGEGEPQSKVVKDILSRQAEQEAAALRNSTNDQVCGHARRLLRLM